MLTVSHLLDLQATEVFDSVRYLVAKTRLHRESNAQTIRRLCVSANAMRLRIQELFLRFNCFERAHIFELRNLIKHKHLRLHTVRCAVSWRAGWLNHSNRYRQRYNTFQV